MVASAGSAGAQRAARGGAAEFEPSFDIGRYLGQRGRRILPPRVESARWKWRWPARLDDPAADQINTSTLLAIEAVDLGFAEDQRVSLNFVVGILAGSTISRSDGVRQRKLRGSSASPKLTPAAGTRLVDMAGNAGT